MNHVLRSITAVFIISLMVGEALAWVVLPCDLGPKPHARLLEKNKYVFIARIQSLTWEDELEGKEAWEYRKGLIKAKF